MNIPRLMITATSSGSGKTLCTCGLLRAFSRKRNKIVSFKCGPDFIDPMFHEKVLGTKSRNLDVFFTGEEVTRNLLVKNTADTELAVMEGVMGYYDGLAGISSTGSAWDVARITKTPAVLLVNCKGLSVSVLAIIKGFLELKEESQIKGVILNRISPMLYPRVKEMIEKTLSVKVFGYLPDMKEISLESRHLGLVLPEEIVDLQRQLDQLADQMEKTIDLDGLFELADGAQEIQDTAFNNLQSDLTEMEIKEEVVKQKVKIAVARDEAFCFFYEDNLDYLRSLGVELIEFSPMNDEKLPEGIHGLILNGGYPELHTKSLSENETMIHSIKEAMEQGLPTTAECGGFLYLHETMKDINGVDYPLVGIVKGYVENKGKLTRFGYITLTEGTVFGEIVGEIPSHEFHYYDSDDCGDAFRASKPLSKRGWNCIHSTDTMMIGFPHIYYYANLKAPQAFVKACVKRAKEENRGQ